jgi:hypothetical protein
MPQADRDTTVRGNTADTHATGGPDTVRVLVYSDDRTVRAAVRMALGRRRDGG